MVAVIVPCYNSERYLEQALASVRGQTFTDWQLILVDDGSSDGTADVCEGACRADRRVRLVCQTHGGIAAARNRGVAEASADAEVVAFLDHDDVWEPDALEQLVEALAADPTAAAAHGLARCIGPDGAPSDAGQLEAHQRARRQVEGGRLVAVPEGVPTTLAVLAFWNCVITAGQVAVRRHALEAVGGFDPAMVPADDWDAWLRICRIGHFAYVPRVVVHWRSHGTNASAAKGTMDEATRRVRSKLLAAPGMTPAERAIARQGYRFDCTVKLAFARDSLVRGEVANAARQLRHAAAGYARYVRAVRAARAGWRGGRT